MLTDAAGLEPVAADARALAEAGFGTWDELAANLRQRIDVELDRLPEPASRHSRRLLELTRAFMESPWLTRAVALGWSLPELFGIDPAAPLTRLDRQGLVVGLALSVIHGGRLEAVEADHATIRFRSGGQLAFRRLRLALDEAVPWWECAVLFGEVQA